MADISKNELQLNDDLFFLDIQSSEPIKFNSVEEINVISGDIHEPYNWMYQATIQIKLSDTTNQYSRNLMNFYEVTGTLGGLFEIFEVGLGALIGIFSSYLFNRDFSNELLKVHIQYRKIQNELDELKKKNKEKSSTDVGSNPSKNESHLPEGFIENVGLKNKEEEKYEPIEDEGIKEEEKDKVEKFEDIQNFEISHDDNRKTLVHLNVSSN